MKNMKIASTILLSSILFVACSQKTINTKDIKKDVTELTKTANNILVEDKKHINEVNNLIEKNNPELIKKFNGYDLRYDYKNKNTIVLVCKNDIALYENLSCNKNNITDYTKENLPCNFYIDKPTCL